MQLYFRIYTYEGKQHLNAEFVRDSAQAFHRKSLSCTTFHNCRNKLLDKLQEEFGKAAAATEAVDGDSMVPLTPVHKETVPEMQALQVAAQAASKHRVCPHLTIMCCSALVCVEHCAHRVLIRPEQVTCMHACLLACCIHLHIL